MVLISLHLPKTAGTSFRAALREHFGERYRDDYADGGLTRPACEREPAAQADAARLACDGLGEAACVHGHFLPAKYLPLAGRAELVFVTWMRDPVTRLFSHYRYWQRSYDPEHSAPHHRKVIEEGWTLEQFCLSETYRNVYTQYLWNFPLERFAFIGISEHYREDLHAFSREYLGTDLVFHRDNVTRAGRDSIGVDAAFVQRVREFHAADMQLYQRALELRRLRLRKRALLDAGFARSGVG